MDPWSNSWDIIDTYRWQTTVRPPGVPTPIMQSPDSWPPSLNGSRTQSLPEQWAARRNAIEDSSKRKPGVPPLVLECSYLSAYEYSDQMYSHFVPAMRDFIDWIFFRPTELSLVARAPLVDASVLSKDVALPTAAFPSDHVSLVADLEWLESRSLL